MVARTLSARQEQRHRSRRASPVAGLGPVDEHNHGIEEQAALKQAWKEVAVIGIGKYGAHPVGMDRHGVPLVKAKYAKAEVAEVPGVPRPCVIGMEASSGTQFLGR